MGSPYGPGPMGGPHAGPPKKSNTNLIVIILVAVVGGGLLILGVMGALAYYGMRNYLGAAKSVEGKASVAALARGIASCAETEVQDAAGNVAPRGLPPSSPRVPASLAQVKGTKFASSPSDWTGDAFTCARFSVPTPQYFQYQWVLTTPGSNGTARAEADLNGDGVAEITIEQDVSCSNAAGSITCSVGPLREKK